MSNVKFRVTGISNSLNDRVFDHSSDGQVAFQSALQDALGQFGQDTPVMETGVTMEVQVYFDLHPDQVLTNVCNIFTKAKAFLETFIVMDSIIVQPTPEESGPTRNVLSFQLKPTHSWTPALIYTTIFRCVNAVLWTLRYTGKLRADRPILSKTWNAISIDLDPDAI